MYGTTLYLPIVVILVVNILGSADAGQCSCRCCSGNNCKAVLLGTIDVSSCEPSPCRSLCQQTYPLNCVNGSGSSIIQCSGTSVSDLKPNWYGSFSMRGNCDKTRCCCPIGTLVSTRVNDGIARITVKLGGACPSSGMSVDRDITLPDGFIMMLPFLTENIKVTLGQDSNSLQLNDPNFTPCAEFAIRSKAGSEMRMNTVLLYVLGGILTMIRIKM